ncbi:MAG: hypothetical protein AAGA73_20845 [Pseudomonadota bacterium]
MSDRAIANMPDGRPSDPHQWKVQHANTNLHNYRSGLATGMVQFTVHLHDHELEKMLMVAQSISLLVSSGS